MENSTMVNAKAHIEEIRKERFWIGVGKNPLSRPLRMAVKYLSAELYSKDVHFLMELIQNAEDNEYLEGVEPSLEFLITSRDITGTGAAATLMIFNNEKGFSQKNIESICSVGDSTKAGNRKRGYIGEKGIGFKSVFLLTATPYIYSNGYQIRFSETPCPECDIAYIIPEWVDNKPCVSEIQEIYGPRKSLPTTTLILPLKHDKIRAVKEQLSTLHPELLLFLSKIKRLCVKEDNENPKLNSVRAISISSERDFMTKKNIDAESYTVHLAAEEGADETEGECRYYMWRQRFPVKAENRVEKRSDIEEWSITLAFPYGKRLNRGMTCSGIYAFLPTETVTNLPFIIQADFLLPSSRETILWDDKWNQGILDCVPAAFINAFVSLVKSSEAAPASSLASMLPFLPVKSSPHSKLNVIRDSIKERLLQENIIISESHSNQKFFHKPNEVGRLMPDFWKILLKAKAQGVKLHNLSSHGTHILHSSFDSSKYNDELNFLGIKFVDSDWYPKCIKSCNLVGVGEDVYMELLCFLAKNWESHFDRATMKSIPLLKYVTASGSVSLLTVNEALAPFGQSYTLCRSKDVDDISWLIDWSTEFTSESTLAFLPKQMQESCFKLDAVLSWMKNHVCVTTMDVREYSDRLKKSLRKSCRVIIAFAHFLHHSYAKNFLNASEVQSLCSQMPLVDRYGGVSVGRKAVLVPANGSKWVDLLGSNPWRDEEFMELSEDYLHSGQYAGKHTPQNELIKFLRRWAGASDIPEICPPNSDFPTVSSPLTKENVFLLLDWIKNLRSRGIGVPKVFLSCIKAGNWLRVRIDGSPNYKPPSQSFLSNSSWGNLLQNGSHMVDIPLVDEKFYDNKLIHYKDELKAIGVMFECHQACEFIGRHLMSLAENYNLTGTRVIAMLNFIRFLRAKYLPVDEFINSIRDKKWMRTSCGERTPIESVLYDDSWHAASTISNIPFIDKDYYRNDIMEYKTELKLLGVMVDLNENYQIVVDHVKSAADLNWLTAKSLLFALKCISNSRRADRLVASLKSAKCLKTNVGYLCPAECFLFDREWGCLLQVFDDFPCIDFDFYGSSVFLYKDALAKIGVVVEFDPTVKKFCAVFKQRASSKTLTKENALKFISCCRNLKNARQTLPADLKACMREAKWIKTRLGDYRSPKDCILFSSEWHAISQITLLPFVDDSVNGYGEGVHEWKEELKSMGVVMDLDEGSHMVLAHIFFPQDPKEIIADSVIALLKCIRKSELKNSESFSEAFLKQVRKTKWLKTTYGYKSPQECLLFTQQKFLQLCDGPFIDEEYYGPLSSYKAELAVLGVIIDLPSIDANSLLAKHLTSLTELAKIERIYSFLNDANWKPADGTDKSIWFPTSNDDGMWVSPSECVLHDPNGLFKSRLHVFDGTKYKSELLFFFSKAFDVKSKPSIDDYCTLWKEWEISRSSLSFDECQAVWGQFMVKFNVKTENLILESVSKVPAFSDASSDILLLSKHDVFIPDDLLLKDFFDKSSPNPLFVWYPQKKSPSISRLRLFHLYSKIGVRKISETATKSELSDINSTERKPVNPKDVHIVKGLVMLILGFLSDPELKIEAKDRHDTINRLLNVKFFETSERISMNYSLKMSTGVIVEVTTSQMVRWSREAAEFICQKLDKSGGFKNIVEYATMFSEVVSEGLLWEKEDLIPRLGELIKFGFLMDFDEDAVTYFMKSKNLQIFAEDEEFLSSAFPSS
ncbi:hypothetical protein RND81_02G047200 [Saponaria officinalis]|uniref:Sacsin/Nov domain-containing protein n=2 Tax=Saponaria officinalis TaxID=3572 RepID=A0AAW1MKK9_SAPOF